MGADTPLMADFSGALDAARLARLLDSCSEAQRRAAREARVDVALTALAAWIAAQAPRQASRARDMLVQELAVAPELLASQIDHWESGAHGACEALRRWTPGRESARLALYSATAQAERGYRALGALGGMQGSADRRQRLMARLDEALCWRDAFLDALESSPEAADAVRARVPPRHPLHEVLDDLSAGFRGAQVLSEAMGAHSGPGTTLRDALRLDLWHASPLPDDSTALTVDLDANRLTVVRAPQDALTSSPAARRLGVRGRWGRVAAAAAVLTALLAAPWLYRALVTEGPADLIATTEGAARLVAATGRIEMRPIGAVSFTALAEGAEIPPGAVLRTGPGATARLETGARPKLTLHPQSLIEIQGRDRWFLEYGDVTVDLGAPATRNEPVRLGSKLGAFTASGGIFRAKVQVGVSHQPVARRPGSGLIDVDVERLPIFELLRQTEAALGIRIDSRVESDALRARLTLRGDDLPRDTFERVLIDALAGINLRLSPGGAGEIWTLDPLPGRWKDLVGDHLLVAVEQGYGVLETLRGDQQRRISAREQGEIMQRPLDVELPRLVVSSVTEDASENHQAARSVRCLALVAAGERTVVLGLPEGPTAPLRAGDIVNVGAVRYVVDRITDAGVYLEHEGETFYNPFKSERSDG